jgi:hypothetical protein
MTTQTDFYARSRKVPITFIMSLRLLSVCPHKSGRLQLVLGTFTKIRRKKPNLLKIGYEDPGTFLQLAAVRKFF